MTDRKEKKTFSMIAPIDNADHVNLKALSQPTMEDAEERQTNVLTGNPMRSKLLSQMSKESGVLDRKSEDASKSQVIFTKTLNFFFLNNTLL